jgi:hypothetical protein
MDTSWRGIRSIGRSPVQHTGGTGIEARILQHAFYPFYSALGALDEKLIVQQFIWPVPWRAPNAADGHGFASEAHGQGQAEGIMEGAPSTAPI